MSRDPGFATLDIRLLVSHFLGDEWEIHHDAMRALQNYSWPWNVRQLINVIERAKILSDNGTVTFDALPHEITESATSSSTNEENFETLASLERAKIREALQRENGNKTRAARVLGITRRSLYRLLEKHHMDTPIGGTIQEPT